jgi:hypothetical protein
LLEFNDFRCTGDILSGIEVVAVISKERQRPLTPPSPT